jgi:ABC-type glycerol-3-phosphate transport system substrate-binding protein
MMHRTRIIGAALLALAACGRSGGGAERQAGTTNVTMSGTPGDITITTPNGTAEIHSGGGAPAALPEGIPAYPNQDPGQAIDINGGSGQGQGRILSFSTHDAPAQVIAFYAQAVAAGGYSVANRMDMGASSTLTARRGEGQAVSIVAVQAGGGTRVQIIVAAGGR